MNNRIQNEMHQTEENSRLTWGDVVKLHGSQAAIKTRNGYVESILCGGSGHRDCVEEHRIEYIVPERNYYKSGIASFHKTAQDAMLIDVFFKMSRNAWRYLGKFVVAKIEKKPGEFTFVLDRLPTESSTMMAFRIGGAN